MEVRRPNILKWLRKLFSNEKEEELITSSLFIRSDEAELKDFFEQIYDTEKFCKWFNFFPIVWLSFDKKYFDVGCTGTIRFSLPPFYYKLQVVKIVPYEFIEMIAIGDTLEGRALFTFRKKGDGYVFEDPHYLLGKNMLIHKYYTLLLAPNHEPFMNWRYSILKKNLIDETLNKKKGKLHND